MLIWRVIFNRWNKFGVKCRITMLWVWFYIIGCFKRMFRWAICRSCGYSSKTKCLDQHTFWFSFEPKSASIAVELVFRLVFSKTFGEEFILDSAWLHFLITTQTNTPRVSINTSARRAYETRDSKTELQCIWKHVKKLSWKLTYWACFEILLRQHIHRE